MCRSSIPFIEEKQLCYRVIRQNVIDDLSLSLYHNQISIIIGPNGAGKSTLLRLLTGFLTPHTGECLLEGKLLTGWDINKLSRKRAVMRQHHQLNFPFSFEEIVAMGRSPYGSFYFSQAIESALIQTDCLALRYRNYQQLSGGEQQRVQLARVIAQLWHPEPNNSYLFLDEPTSALDLYHQQQSLRLLHRLNRQQSIGVCCILHDLNLAALYADRIYLLYEGQLVSVGTPQQVMTEENLRRWYRANLYVKTHPDKKVPQIFLRH
ncbi:MAG TPA: heme ABC transporter ATP-binding protein [Arsenophonus apicola]|uniref:heme ABC transporter ATP-binding protein n=1 Tax=Arsenophonus apicola TaxID=2879119 RepID=UPI001CDCCED4|nr:heme ABC transporter ATP-binding protein [Arsenophonus apicola]UBX30383.1 heme ABC transporter ATP-binding protein [Arsenophonus apicola]